MLQSRGLPTKATLIAISLLATTLGYAQTEETSVPTPTTPSPESPEAPKVEDGIETGKNESPNPAPKAIQSPAQTEQTKTPEKITVTGSRIKRTESETSAPVGVITRDQIQKSGTVSMGEFFQKSAASSPTGNFTGASGYVSAGSSTIDLLGLGADRTLILVNGKRLPTLPGIGSVNVETIPTALVEKIEILSGGASAVYGADAVGGVVNIVTRKDLVGSEAQVYVNSPMRAGGEEQSYTVSQGVQVNDDVNVAVSAGFRRRNAIDIRHRDLKRSVPERTQTLSNAPAGTYSYQPVYVGADGISVGDWAPSPSCPEDKRVATVPEEPGNVYCVGPRSGLRSELIPKKEEWFAATTLDYQINDKWNLGGLVSFTSATTTNNNGHAMYATDPLSDSPIILSIDKATALGVPVDPNAAFIQLYGPTTEAQDQIYVNKDSTFVAGLYLTGEISDWTTSFGLSYASASARRNGQHMINKEARSSIFVNADDPNGFGADPAFIPIDPNRDINLLRSTTADLNSEEWSDTFAADAFASRPLFSLPGGDFVLGFGASFTAERFKQTPDTLDTLKASNNEPLYVGTFANAGKGDRTVGSVYAEFLAPVHQKVDVDGALRFDAYSDVDPSVNYGLGTKIKIIPELALRGRAASSYKAPPLAYVHQKGGGGYFTVEDPAYCARENAENRFCDPASPGRQVYVDFPGNDKLDPEVGVNYNVGLILEPVPGLALTTDYYWVFLNKTFQVDDFQRVVDRWYAANPGSTTGGNQGDNAVQVDEDGIISQIGTPYRNLGRTHVSLWQTKGNYQYNFKPFIVGFESEYSRMVSYKIQEAEGLANRQLRGTYGVPEWRWNNSLDLGVKNHMFTVSSRTVAQQHPDQVNSSAFVLRTKVGPYTEYDTVYSGELPWNGAVQVGVNNVFNTIGGLAAGSAVGAEDVVSNSLYSYYGRSYFARYTQRL
ncbi:MAG: hypothetical protein EOP04_09980 [Proteobacteria bacterium]|nr:MAG: hypothetical protein EOP04_09980 [Pseudomonadota bacterium]